MSKLALLLLLAAATATAAPTATPTTPTPTPTPTPTFDAQIRTAALTFSSWRRVDDALRFAPENCAAPMPAKDMPPMTVRQSAAPGGPHGKKLYYLFASDARAYLHAGAALPIGTSVVKQSFEAVHGGSGDGLTTTDGERLTVGAPKDLFVMVKVGAEDAAGTDQGWIYGTFAPDVTSKSGGMVTSQGRVASCMGCHVHATRERLFGLAARVAGP